jgi:hypothetical protein
MSDTRHDTQQDSHRHDTGREDGRHDTGREDGRQESDKILERVRGLLAKAQSTEFPEEAEALAAKAQELMTRHSLDAAMVEAAQQRHGAGAAPELMVIKLHPPYVNAKSVLVGSVARANRCQAVLDSKSESAYVVGFATDLEAVNVLFTSLLAQSTTSMLRAARQPQVARTMHAQPPDTSSRTFRQSFLVSFAARISERLQEAAAKSRHEAEQTYGAELLPVLAARDDQVEQAVAQRFGRSLRNVKMRVSSAAGWHAGRDAADNAAIHSQVAAR